MKRIRSDFAVAEAIDHHEVDCEINKTFYKHHYPLELRETLMHSALNGKLYLDEKRFKLIENLLDNNKLSLQHKFYFFIDILSMNELAALGW
jgi:hypothetical protein